MFRWRCRLFWRGARGIRGGLGKLFVCGVDITNRGTLNHGLIHCEEKIDEGAGAPAQKVRCARKRQGGKNVKQAPQCLQVREDEGRKDMSFYVHVSTPELRLRNTGVG